MCAGWVAVSYLKSEMMTRLRAVATEDSDPSTLNTSTVQIADGVSPEAKPLSSPVRLVYSCGEDKEYYHASTHLPTPCDRTALSEETAIRRGLKHCAICLPD
jgi:hypothetical protein